MARYTAPKSIASHPGVAECCYGPDSGVEDYKHEVFLKEGWVFKRGRMAECRTGHFHTVEDFKFAEPVKVAPDACQWFALCDNPAVTTEPHPVLGAVPICQRCADKVARLKCA
jgi:hypothetical protein